MYDIMHIVTATKEGSKTKWMLELVWETRILFPVSLARLLSRVSHRYEKCSFKRCNILEGAPPSIGRAVANEIHRPKTCLGPGLGLQSPKLRRQLLLRPT